MSNMDPVSDLLTGSERAPGQARPGRRSDLAQGRDLRILKEQASSGTSCVDQTPQSVLRIFLERRREGTPAITHLAAVSKPGQRSTAARRRSVRINGRGLGVVSTNVGLLSDGRRASSVVAARSLRGLVRGAMSRVGRCRSRSPGVKVGIVGDLHRRGPKGE
jgi:hypothetical protein